MAKNKENNSMGKVLQVKKITPTNIPKSFLVMDLKKKNDN